MSNRRKVQHVTDSLARARVAGSIPEAWEWRETTGRDYGIDIYVEPFEDEDTLGSILFVQIKGRQLNAQDDAEVGLTYDTSAILYAERFLSPMVLAYCPVKDQRPSFRFIWLQEYIRVRLPVDAEDWRNRKRNRLYFRFGTACKVGRTGFFRGTSGCGTLPDTLCVLTVGAS